MLIFFGKKLGGGWRWEEKEASKSLGIKELEKGIRLCVCVCFIYASNYVIKKYS